MKGCRVIPMVTTHGNFVIYFFSTSLCKSFIISDVEYEKLHTIRGVIILSV